MISALSSSPEGARQAEPAQPLLKVRGLTRLFGV